MDEPTVEVIEWPGMDRPDILSTFLYCGENPIPQREPPNDDDEKALSGLLTDD